VIVLLKEPQKPVQQPTKSMPIPQCDATKVPDAECGDESESDDLAGACRFVARAGKLRGALAELEKARTLDPLDESVRKEMEQTKRACNAERVLGNPVNC
jgi:methyl coenzyme M reductase subunit C-like uncharacterized protein (methanogenesis marker protein 7)